VDSLHRGEEAKVFGQALGIGQGGLASMPFLITISSENMSCIASQIMFGIATSTVICGLIAGKISSFKLGEDFRDAVACRLIVMLELFVGAAMGWV
jgi:hypothetical protein